MNLEQLTDRQKEIYTKVEDYRKMHPDRSSLFILKELGLNPSTYAAAKRVLRTSKGDKTKRKYNRRSQMITIPVEEPSTPIVVAFVGDSASVVKSVNEFMKGR